MKTTAFVHLGIAVAFMLLCGIGYLFWSSTVSALSVREKDLAAQIEAKSGARALSASEREQLAALAESETYVSERLVPVANIADFLSTLEAAGAPYSAKVSTVSVSDASSDGRVDIALSITGSFSSVMRTVGAIDYAPRATSIRTLSLDTNGEGVWTAAVLLTVAVAAQ